MLLKLGTVYLRGQYEVSQGIGRINHGRPEKAMIIPDWINWKNWVAQTNPVPVRFEQELFVCV
ncbi:hypothetical protein KsCSTR_39510 [Candidatus Kuenenia stuttgartiensis]|uniref:Uncharacterized protein n=1 Tax=Kuenenia stuttgartiensis TaxID=174633 RepID=Q1PUK2_KUEST|nr:MULTISPECIES: hypothetical protein [Kuenenia]MBE7548160.1 hypothetical protein [Planctomycetia bacterium]MBW7942388.1 hypothetical protein [Candidatus Kuenenia stuttgartiensis]MBZ0192720.1 hypothetical protein [Candidatus Kuenenia stuttgartiensis]MCF6152615.1 hypothetical protein [Candidatus Kuenenia stuttgartiensis]MCL4726880.1 hypothetical protein [Candidatus Kuenenia stuttgartiensis]